MDNKPETLDTLVDYQEGSVVSRTLAKNAGGSVTVFAFAQGQSISEHAVPFDAFVVVLDGEADITLGGKTMRVGAGQGLLMPAKVPHALSAPEPFKMILSMISAA